MEPDESEIRTITSVVQLTQLPSVHGQINMPFLYAPYASYREDFVVLMD